MEDTGVHFVKMLLEAQIFFVFVLYLQYCMETFRLRWKYYPEKNLSLATTQHHVSSLLFLAGSGNLILRLLQQIIINTSRDFLFV